MSADRVIIAGTRGRLPWRVFRGYVEPLLAKLHNPVIFYRDDNTDVDRMVAELAREKGFQLVPFPAHWQKEGKGAGMHRNHHMAHAATHAILFWDGFSPDIRHLVDITKKMGIKRKVILLDMQ